MRFFDKYCGYCRSMQCKCKPLTSSGDTRTEPPTPKLDALIELLAKELPQEPNKETRAYGEIILGALREIRELLKGGVR